MGGQLPQDQLIKALSNLAAMQAVGVDIGSVGNQRVNAAIQQGLLAPVTTLPTQVLGIPVLGQQRIQQTLEAIGPSIRADEASTPGQAMLQSLRALRALPHLPPNFPDINLGPPTRLIPGFRPLTIEEILRRRRGAI